MAASNLIEELKSKIDTALKYKEFDLLERGDCN